MSWWKKIFYKCMLKDKCKELTSLQEMAAAKERAEVKNKI